MNEKIKRIVGRIRKDPDVVAVMLFGSYARKKQYARDIDLCIVLDKGYDKKFMGRKRLRYLSFAANNFDIQIFQLLPLYIRVKILKEGKILYLNDSKKIYEEAYETIRDFDLFEKHYKDYISVAA